MQNLYIAKDTIIKSINYFKTQNYEKDPNYFGLFLLFKAINMNEYIDFPASKFNKDNTEIFKILFMLGCLADPTESPNKKSCLFPLKISSTIKQKDYYNGGTEFYGLLGRIKDTVDNTLVDSFINSNKTEYSFKHNYLYEVSTKFLNGAKINLTYLCAWIYRFSTFEVDDDFFKNKAEKKKEFKSICIKKFLNEFNINNKEKDAMFFESSDDIIPSETRITGAELRSQLSFERGNEPDILPTKSAADKVVIEMLKINEQETKKLSLPTGKNLSENEVHTLLIKNKQIILFGPPGTGKTWLIDKIKSKFDENKIIQFHPGLSYEEFIGGIRFNPIESENKLEYMPGTFLSLCWKAKANPEKNFLFVIDEINRGNIPHIFGETIMALDRGNSVDLNFTVKIEGKSINKMDIPKNLYILGTMNSADRSIALVDYALRRRFLFIRFNPNNEIVRSMANLDKLKEIDIASLFEGLNAKLLEALRDEDILIGHSYFLPNWALKGGEIIWDIYVLMDVFNYSIIPILEEYTYGKKNILESIVGPKLVDKITDDKIFLQEIIKQFPNCKKQ